MSYLVEHVNTVIYHVRPLVLTGAGGTSGKTKCPGFLSLFRKSDFGFRFLLLVQKGTETEILNLHILRLEPKTEI